ncbi:hypothetical protein JYP52_23395 [Nitratireductor aquibiodomus]|uniref:hypothetical protein n=1 Tax=Nitratireductor aquibiodomus TaxID=204799 RepID=UPI0019D367AF|nr:hypothetical protein [Nitratireductor aquibiodomus]MBN7764086.1 hypothetical protein [Nitratireductor aquibiodomus]
MSDYVSNEDELMFSLYKALKHGKSEQAASSVALNTREYMKLKKRQSRARERAELEKGVVPFNAKTARDALADAAMAILATDADGATHIRKVLRQIFNDKPGAPLRIEADARSGKLKPRFLK